MDINSLQVFNSMYQLGITDEEFRAIEDEQKHTERTGLSIKCVKKKGCVCVSHDEKHEILIKRMNSKVGANTRVLFKTLITFDDLPEEIYTLHQIAQYRTLDDEFKYVANNLEELKDRVCDRFADGYPKKFGECFDYDHGYYRYDDDDDTKAEMAKERQEIIAKQVKALFWLFGEDFDSFQFQIARKNIPRIVKVFSRNNRRVAILQINEDYERQRGGMMGWNRWIEQVKQTTLKLKTYTPRDERYNYVAPNREVFINDEFEIWIDDDLFEKLEHAELEVLSERSERLSRQKRDYVILNADKYNQVKSSVRLEMMSAKRREQEESAKSQLAKRIVEQFKAGKVVRQGIEFTRTTISCGGVVFRGDRLGDYVVGQNIILQEQPDFTQIYEGYIDYILDVDARYRYSHYSDGDREIRNIQFKGKTDISIGEIKLKLSKVGNNFYVQLKGKKPHRINREDIPAVLKSAINYTKRPEEYENYLTQTSRVSLKLQNALEQGGFKFDLEIDEAEDNPFQKSGRIFLAVALLRKDGKNYVIVQGQEYKVKNTQALFDLNKEVDGYLRNGKLQRTIKLLYRAVDGITPNTIGSIITQGRQEYDKIMAKIRAEEKAKTANSLKFLNHAIRLSKARKVKGGYLVRGLSGNCYYVDREGGVWTVKRDGERYVNDKYLCVIDVGTDKETKWGKNDAIAKRLLALSKDSVVANEIYQKGDRMDVWWNNIVDHRLEKVEEVEEVEKVEEVEPISVQEVAVCQDG